MGKPSVLSEYGPGQAPSFILERNRIIAGLCQAVIVAEALNSFGVYLRECYGRSVETFLLFREIFDGKSAGCHHLDSRRLSAKLVTSGQDI